ncbi:hypothetical protein BDN70DRAFT_905784 [Pholiota conissans]|uniref:SAGA-associated factor 11 n=1 Tax=Pholiota conissans TaxID=109636 RepID=A0A9P5Z3I6_9AGAR|nr:hypothetical protein BDN70DRAFT_905784 [Pholiota conissans]
MPKSERDETLGALTARVFAAMLEELVMDATLQSHHEVARGRAVCAVCKTRHETAASGHVASRAGTPSSAASAEVPLLKSHPNGTGTSTPTSQKDGNIILECVSCSRQIASNRYAPHLSSCMGLSTARRGAARTSTKIKAPSDPGRSVSPMSDAGQASDDMKANGKSKSKAKGKKPSDEGDFSLKRKRPDSPQISPNKKAKKGKPSGSPVSRVKADPDLSGLPTNSHFSPSTNSHSKVPSKLRDSSTASFLERSSSSRESSPEGGPFVATPASSFSSQSPARPLAAASKITAAVRGRPPATGTGPPKRHTPPNRPPPIHVPDYHIEIDHANETGSSTDTDSD